MPETGKVKNVSGEDLSVGWLNGRLALAGQAVEVPIEDVFAYTQQSAVWAPFDAAAKQAHETALAAAEARHAAELAALEPEAQPTAEDAEAVLTSLLADANAKDLVEVVKAMPLHEAQVVLAYEHDAAKPRSTVVAAAAKRIADLQPNDDNTGDDNTDDDNTDDEKQEV